MERIHASTVLVRTPSRWLTQLIRTTPRPTIFSVQSKSLWYYEDEHLSFSEIVGVGDVQVTTSTFGLFGFREALDQQGQDNYFGSGPVELGAMVVTRGCICCTHMMIAFLKVSTQLKMRLSPKLWHRRLGVRRVHSHWRRSCSFLRPDVAWNPCEYCLFGKQYRVLFLVPL